MKISLINKLLILILSVSFLFLLWTKYTSTSQININRASVIKEMRALNRMETATFTIDKIVDAGTNGNVLQEFLYGDKVLLIAHGQVIAGFDFESLSEKDIRIEGKKISVTLPAPTILVSKLDNEQTKVYDRTRGLLAPKNSDLEARARSAAETSIMTAACDGGILNQARDNGIKQLTSFFKSLGFAEVTVNSPQADC